MCFTPVEISLIYLTSQPPGEAQPERHMNKLTNELYREFSRMYAERAHSATVYSGYGTTIDQMIAEFLEMAVNDEH